MTELIQINQIKQDSALQPRDKMDTAIIDEYTEAMKRGDVFPAIVVYKIRDEYFLADGYHRFMAAQGANLTEMRCDVRVGTMREAVLFSAGANATHGVRRTNADKYRAVQILLKDREWKEWTDPQIAAACNVSPDLVGNIRRSILPPAASTTSEKKRVIRAGKVIKMDTSKIGKNQKRISKKSVVQDEDGYVEGLPPKNIQLASNSNENKPSGVPESAKETESSHIANSSTMVLEVPPTAPLEVIGGCRTLTQAEAGEPVPPVTAPQPLEPKKDKHFYANGLYSCLGLVTQKEMAQIKKEHPLWKTNADVFYYGVQALLEKNPQRMVS